MYISHHIRSKVVCTGSISCVPTETVPVTCKFHVILALMGHVSSGCLFIDGIMG
jgi:hypothetical protein